MNKNILSLIEKYNEKGIFINTNQKIYWFNGKRFEFCFLFLNSTQLIQINNELYTREGFLLFKHLHKQKFQPLPLTTSTALNLFASWNYFVVMGNKVIKNQNVPKKRNNDYGNNFVASDDCIYSFSSFRDKSEKYDFKIQQWCFVQSPPNVALVNDMIFFKGYFYQFQKDGYLLIYNCFNDQWETKDVNEIC